MSTIGVDMSSGLTSFKKAVAYSANTDSLEIIPCIGAEANTIVFCELFRHTDKEVSMAIGSLSGEISEKPEYYAAIKNCLRANIKFKVLFIDNRNEESNILELFKLYPDNVTMSQCSDEGRILLKEAFKSEGNICHFAIFDDNKYRKETNTKLFISEACFNSPQENRRLRSIFSSIIKVSNRI